MSQLTILAFPDPRLRTIAKPVESVNDTIRNIASNMLETMYAAQGIGLAATQVNIHQRIIVIDISESRNQPMIFINPTISVLDERTQIYQEGCLSVPGFYDSVERAEHVMINALNQHGESFSLEAKELLATCIQHEIDHLDGKLFVDYLSSLKRERIKDKLKKQLRDKPSDDKSDSTAINF